MVPIRSCVWLLSTWCTPSPSTWSIRSSPGSARSWRSSPLPRTTRFRLDSTASLSCFNKHIQGKTNFLNSEICSHLKMSAIYWSELWVTKFFDTKLKRNKESVKKEEKKWKLWIRNYEIVKDKVEKIEWLQDIYFSYLFSKFYFRPWFSIPM